MRHILGIPQGMENLKHQDSWILFRFPRSCFFRVPFNEQFQNSAYRLKKEEQN